MEKKKNFTDIKKKCCPTLEREVAYKQHEEKRISIQLLKLRLLTSFKESIFMLNII